jgi:hypothetical protein
MNAAHPPSLADVLAQLEAKARPDSLAGMARYGMSVDKRLGVSVPELRRIAKHTGQDHALALQLWTTGLADARILASMIAVPEELTERQMESWVKKRGLRPDRLPYRARQAGGRPGLHGVPAGDHACRHRRAPLRKEGGQLGVA